MTIPDPLEPSPGLEVLGYRLVRRLGKGGFGEVWRATGRGGFDVAVKFVQRQTGAEKAERRSLQILRVVKHLHLLTVFDADEVGPYLVIVMELAGGSLLDRWRACHQEGKPGIPRSELLRYMLHAAEGLDYLNAPNHTIDGIENVGIQHRDIKPHNLLLVGDAVKVADFGLARLQQGSAASHSGSMTLAYAPPEFFQNRTTTRSDQFSLAVTYVQLRTGRLPFGETMQEILSRHLHSQEGPDLRGLPEVERAAVAKALARDPADRHAGCKLFVMAVRAALRAARRRTDPPTDVTTPTLTPATTPPPAEVAPSLPETVPPASSSLAEWETVPTEPARQVAEPFRGHTDIVRAVAWSPDGKRVLTASEDKTARVWDAQDGEQRLVLQGHTHKVVAVAWSPDGKHLLTGGVDDTARVWDARTGTQVRCLKGHAGSVTSVTWSPNSKYILTGSWDYSAKVWDAGTGKELRTLKGSPACVVESVAWCTDGRRVLTGKADGTARVWDLADGRELLCLDGHVRGVTGVAWSPDGKYILTGSTDDTAQIWDASDGKQLHILRGGTGFVYSVSWHPLGRHVATGTLDWVVKVWDPSTGREVLAIEGEAAVYSLAYSPDGRFLLGCERNAARIWDAATGECVLGPPAG